MIQVAILDDYAHVAARLADWGVLAGHCHLDFLDRPVFPPASAPPSAAAIDIAAKKLSSYAVLCHLRERTPMPRALIERLPELRLVTITGDTHRTLDVTACTERGILVCHTAPRPGSGQGQGTPELTIGLMLALMRHIAVEHHRLRAGQWQSTVGATLWGKTLGLIGLGRVGRRVAELARAFGMEVIAWSPNLTASVAGAAGARLVTKDDLFATSDIVSLHLVLGDRSRGAVAARELALMKPTAVIINTARGPLIDEQDLIAALAQRRIAGAALDVFWQEPLPADHLLTRLDNVLITPHLGYAVKESFAPFYADTVQNISAWLDGSPIRVVNSDAPSPTR